MKESKFQRSWDDWYWSYAYGSKIACINYVNNCTDISEEEKEKIIAYHTNNLGKHKP